MREGIGSIVLYNIIIIFIVITFGFLSATLSYMKAFKVNGKIAHILEKFEGYNSLSEAEIRNTLETLGYRKAKANCDIIEHNKHKYEPIDTGLNVHEYCLYEYNDKANGDLEGNYLSYGIITYIHVDIPIFGGYFKVPVQSESESIFKFAPDTLRDSNMPNGRTY